MNTDFRLAEVVTALEQVNIDSLVMGGHAVRYYGLNRNTADFDLHIAPDAWDELGSRLARASLFAGKPVQEGPSWRPGKFRRFQIGRLFDGREEWLECWRTNHLLPPFPDLLARSEMGIYGGRPLYFLSLPDLIRSKETERTVDWQDIGVLEEFLDFRMLAQADAFDRALPDAIRGIRSRSGFEAALQKDLFADRQFVGKAMAATSCSITQAFLLPFAPTAIECPPTNPAIEPVILRRLRTVSPASPLHLTLVEAVRRQYRLVAQAADKADKQAESLGAER